MPASINLVGRKFDCLLVTKSTDFRENGCKVWECLCDCGKTKLIRTSVLKISGFCSPNCKMIPKKNALKLEGQKFGRLLVVKKIGTKKNNSIWLCKCDCGKEKEVLGRSLKHWGIKSCGCLVSPKYSGKILQSMFNRIKENAKFRKLEFLLTVEYLDKIFKQQNERCALSGISISFNKPGYARNKNLKGNVSLDRIDSSKGYVEGNVQWVDKNVNIAKQALTDEQFVELCKNVVKYQNEKTKTSRPQNQ